MERLDFQKLPDWRLSGATCVRMGEDGYADDVARKREQT